MKKREKICIAISAIIILWLFVSFIEVNAKNLEPNPQYNNWNAFVLLTENERLLHKFSLHGIYSKRRQILAI